MKRKPFEYTQYAHRFAGRWRRHTTVSKADSVLAYHLVQETAPSQMLTDTP